MRGARLRGEELPALKEQRSVVRPRPLPTVDEALEAHLPLNGDPKEFKTVSSVPEAGEDGGSLCHVPGKSWGEEVEDGSEEDEDMVASQQPKAVEDDGFVTPSHGRVAGSPTRAPLADRGGTARVSGEQGGGPFRVLEKACSNGWQKQGETRREGFR